ncbi:MAG TPA: hypothetical protein VEQ58_12170, partial [Polyangiaceae bacterium]|nr:hypothetical protein [Polyangiaceae bacterium]
MRKTFVFVALLLLLAALGVSLVVGASKTRAYASQLLQSGSAPSASASGSARVVPSSSGSSASAAPSSSGAAPAAKPAERNLSVVGLGWDLLAPGLLAAEGLKSSSASPFTGA